MKKRKLTFVADYPEILKEWDFELNDLDPSKVSSGTNKKVNWICSRNHRWVDTVSHRINGKRKCPYCNNSKVWPGFNDVESQRPDLLKEWDYANNEIKPSEVYYKSSHKKVWWVCPKCKAHYTMSPGNRERGQNCPYCARKRIKPGVNDLETIFPEISKEWDYEKNGGIIPSQVAPHSDKKAWWICPKGHSYQTSINNKTGSKGVRCPICTNKIVVPGINDIKTTNPDILQYWDYEKNNNLLPSQFSAGSNKKVWWKCEKGHSFRTQIDRMIHSKKGMNCPVCRNIVIVPGVNDLATKCPLLMEEWDFDKNVLKITEVGTGSQKKAWWKCKKGHSWKAVISSRALNNHGCPYCSNQKPIVGENDLGTLMPEILEYWDYDKNINKPSDYAGKTSNRKVWLKCRNNHSWRVRIGDFNKGQRCPYCGNKRIEVGFNDLATTHPILVKEWDYDKNDSLLPTMVTFGTHKKVWWKCEKGHSWKAAIYSRASNNRGCPACLREYQTSITEKAFSYYLSIYFRDLEENVRLPELLKRELDMYVPSIKLAVEYDGYNWHKNPKKDLIKDELCFKNGIKLIRIREEGCVIYESTAYSIRAPRNHGNLELLEKPINDLISLINELYSLSIPKINNIKNDINKINERFFTFNKSNSLLAKKPELEKEWNYEKNGSLTPGMISAKSNMKVWWKCEKGHEWLANVQSRERGNGCPYCSGKYVLKGFNDLASQYPSLVKEWDFEKNVDLNPNEILAGSNLKVWWKCSRGHSWETKISTRTRMGSGCPTCAGLLPIKGDNDLETLYPELAKEWDYDKNGDMKPSDFLPGSEKVVWWKCPKGHSYDTQIAIRAKYKCGCPVCNNKRVVKGINDLETLHPELAAEWDYDKNGGLLPSQVGGGGGSHKKVWWKCSKGHEWCAALSSRIGLHTGCPTCAIERNRKK